MTDEAKPLKLHLIDAHELDVLERALHDGAGVDAYRAAQAIIDASRDRPADPDFAEVESPEMAEAKATALRHQHELDLRAKLLDFFGRNVMSLANRLGGELMARGLVDGQGAAMFAEREVNAVNVGVAQIQQQHEPLPDVAP